MPLAIVGFGRILLQNGRLKWLLLSIDDSLCLPPQVYLNVKQMIADNGETHQGFLEERWENMNGWTTPSGLTPEKNGVRCWKTFASIDSVIISLRLHSLHSVGIIPLAVFSKAAEGISRFFVPITLCADEELSTSIVSRPICSDVGNFEDANRAMTIEFAITTALDPGLIHLFWIKYSLHMLPIYCPDS